MQFFDYRQKSRLPDKYEAGGAVMVMAVHAASGMIAIGTASGSLEIWKYSVKNQSPILEKMRSIKPYATGNWVVGLHFSADAENLISVARSGLIDQWTTSGLEKLKSFTTSVKSVHSVAFDPVNNLMALGGSIGTGGPGTGLVELVFLPDEQLKTFKVNISMPAVEFIPSHHLLVIAQLRSTSVYDTRMETLLIRFKNKIKKIIN